MDYQSGPILFKILILTNMNLHYLRFFTKVLLQIFFCKIKLHFGTTMPPRIMVLTNPNALYSRMLPGNFQLSCLIVHIPMKKFDPHCGPILPYLLSTVAEGMLSHKCQFSWPNDPREEVFFHIFQFFKIISNNLLLKSDPLFSQFCLRLLCDKFGLNWRWC